MKRTMLKSKIHRATVTEANLEYEGSVSIDTDLLAAADILPYEAVDIWDCTSGARLRTYAIPGEAGSGEICVNGACVGKDGGTEDAGTPAPPEVRLGGGLCSSSAGLATGGAIGAALVGVLGAAALARRGRRRGTGSGHTGE